MSSRERLFRPNCYNVERFNAMLKSKTNRSSTEFSPFRKVGQTLPKFQKVYSESRLSRSNSAQTTKPDFDKQTKKVYSRLFSDLQEIKQALKQSLVNVGQNKKRSVKRKQKVITQISDAGLKYSPLKKANNYYDVLKHIEEIKDRNKVNKTQKSVEHKSQEQQKTLFYGVEYINNIQFKVKIKLSRTTYALFAKNSHTKIMVQMSYAEYMKLNLSELKGNPCNILALLKIENNKVKFKLKSGADKKKFFTFKSFLGYY